MDRKPKVCVNAFEKVNGVIFYHIITQYQGKNKQIKRRFSSFESLHKKLKEYFDIPDLPRKNYITFLIGKSDLKIEQRQNALDSYLKYLVDKPEIFHSQPLRIFLQLDEFAHPDQIYVFEDFVHGIRDFTIDFEQGIMFVLYSDSSVFGKMEAYFNNRKICDSGSEIIPIGCLECWVQSDEEYHRSWVKSYKCETTCLSWSSNILLIGLENGHVNYLKLQDGKYIESLDIELHQQKVNSIIYYNGYIHSIASDLRYRVLKLDKEQLVYDIMPGGHQLSYLSINDERKVSLIADLNGSIFIFDIQNGVPQQIVKISTQLNQIKGITLDAIRGYLFVISYENGQIGIFDISKNAVDKYGKQIQLIHAKSKSREILWSTKRGEILIGNSDGTVTIWDAKQRSPICNQQLNQLILDIIHAHNKEITRMMWFEQEQTLITGSKDRTIKAWRLPMRWATYEEEQTIGIRTKQIDMDDITGWNQ